MDAMLPRLGDLREDSGEELEDIEGLPLPARCSGNGSRRRVAAPNARSAVGRNAGASGSGPLQKLVHEQYVTGSVMKATTR